MNIKIAKFFLGVAMFILAPGCLWYVGMHMVGNKSFALLLGVAGFFLMPYAYSLVEENKKNDILNAVDKNFSELEDSFDIQERQLIYQCRNSIRREIDRIYK